MNLRFQKNNVSTGSEGVEIERCPPSSCRRLIDYHSSRVVSDYLGAREVHYPATILVKPSPAVVCRGSVCCSVRYLCVYVCLQERERERLLGVYVVQETEHLFVSYVVFKSCLVCYTKFRNCVILICSL